MVISEAAPEVGVHLELGVFADKGLLSIGELLVVAKEIEVFLRKLYFRLKTVQQLQQLD